MFREILQEARKGEEAIYSIRKMNLDIDSLFDDPKSYKDVEKAIDYNIDDENGAKDMQDGMSVKEYEKYMNYLYDIQDDPKGALKGLQNHQGTGK